MPSATLFPSSIAVCLVVFLASCGTREPIPILEEYEVELARERATRSYYHRMPENDTTWTDCRVTLEDGQKFATIEHFVDGMISSYEKVRITDQGRESVEKVFYVSDSTTGAQEPVPARIMEHVSLGEDARFRGEKHVEYYETALGIGSKMRSQYTFAGEEAFLYDGQEVPSLKFDYHSTITTYFKYFPFYSRTIELNGHVMVSRGIGTTYATWQDESDGSSHSEQLLWTEYMSSPDGDAKK